MLWFKCRLYPASAGSTTRYIPQERARSSKAEEAALRAKPEVLLRLYERAPFPEGYNGSYFLLT